MNASAYGTTKVHQVNSINRRLELIGDQVYKSQQDPWLRHLALEVAKGTPQHGSASEDAEVVQVFYFVKNNIEYRQDPRDFDYYATGRRTMQFRAGDCDDHTILVAGMMGHLGFLTGAKVVSNDGANWHIYPLACVRSKGAPSAFIAMDTTQTESYPGWEPGAIHRRHELLVTFSGGRTHVKKLH